MMDNNYKTSRILFDTCMAQGIRLLYASSAATYGGSSTFVEHPDYERPLNVYGYSKLLFDQVVRSALHEMPCNTNIQAVGFRYFNVYGPGEQHKGRMASVAFQHFNQYRAEGKIKLFGSYEGYGPGQHTRDFIFIDDVVAVNLWFFDHPEVSGVFNLGSGRTQPFNAVGHAVINALRAANGQTSLTLEQMVENKLIEYIEFPAALAGKYQCFTLADLSHLRRAGCDHAFADVTAGVRAYMQQLLG